MFDVREQPPAGETTPAVAAPEEPHFKERYFRREQPPGETTPAVAAPEQRHLKEYYRIVAAHWKVLVGTFMLAVLAALMYVQTCTPIYRAYAQLEIASAKTNVTEVQGVYDPTLAGVGGEMARREYRETQYQIILSRPLLEKTFKECGFDTAPEFKTATDKAAPDPVAAFKKLFAVRQQPRTRLAWVTFDWRDAEKAKTVLQKHVENYLRDYRETAAGVTKEGLAQLREQEELLRSRLLDSDAALQKFREDHNEISFDKETNLPLERLKVIKADLNDVQRRRLELQSKSEDIQRTLAAQGSLEDLPEVVGSQSIRDLKLEYIRANQDLSDLSGRFGPNHPEVAAATARVKAVSEKIQSEIRSIRASVEAELARTQSQEKQLKKGEQEQQHAVMEFTRLSGQYQAMRRTYETLDESHKRVADRIEEINLAMTAGSSAKSQDGKDRPQEDDNVWVREWPMVPSEPVKPRKTRTMALAVVGGLALGVLLCFFREYLDTTLKDKDDVERRLRLTVIGFVPKLEGAKVKNGDKAAAPDAASGAKPATPGLDSSAPVKVRSSGEHTAFRLVPLESAEGKSGESALSPELDKEGASRTKLEFDPLERPHGAGAEAFRSIRTALTFSALDEPRRFLVTSSRAGEGKTLVSFNIAIAAAQAVTTAQAGKDVLLIDADMRRPRVHKIFNIDDKKTPGLGDLFLGERARTVRDAVKAFDIVEHGRNPDDAPGKTLGRVHVMTAGILPPNPTELLGSERMKQILEEASREFDVVILDTPPAGQITDAVVLSRFVSGAVLVVRNFYTERGIAMHSRDLLRSAGGRILGVVLNGIDMPRGYYYKQYYYYYYHEDGSKRRWWKRRRHRHANA